MGDENEKTELTPFYEKSVITVAQNYCEQMHLPPECTSSVIYTFDSWSKLNSIVQAQSKLPFEQRRALVNTKATLAIEVMKIIDEFVLMHLIPYQYMTWVEGSAYPRAEGLRYKLRADARILKGVKSQKFFDKLDSDNPMVGYHCDIDFWNGEHYDADGWCLSLETRVMMSDFTWKLLGDIKVNDSVMGLDQQYHITPTEVLGVSDRKALAYRVFMEDDSNFVASADHKFLARLPHPGAPLIWQNTLYLPGHVLVRASTPSKDYRSDSEYKLGYFLGVSEGDGYFSLRESSSNLFGIAMVDKEAVDRVSSILTEWGVGHAKNIRDRSKEHNRQNMYTLTVASGKGFNYLYPLRGTWHENYSFCAGYLGGIYDAEGSGGKYSRITITNTNDAILDRIRKSCACFSFSFGECTRIRSGDRKVVTDINLSGGVGEVSRFLSTAQPAIERKRTVGFRRITQSTRYLSEIEPLGNRDLRDIKTGTGNFIAEGYVAHNCDLAELAARRRSTKPSIGFMCMIAETRSVRRTILKALGLPSGVAEEVQEGLDYEEAAKTETPGTRVVVNVSNNRAAFLTKCETELGMKPEGVAEKIKEVGITIEEITDFIKAFEFLKNKKEK